MFPSNLSQTHSQTHSPRQRQATLSNRGIVFFFKKNWGRGSEREIRVSEFKEERNESDLNNELRLDRPKETNRGLGQRKTEC